MKGKEEREKYSVLNIRYILIMTIIIIAGVLIIGSLSGCGRNAQGTPDTLDTGEGTEQDTAQGISAADSDRTSQTGTDAPRGSTDSAEAYIFHDDEGVYTHKSDITAYQYDFNVAYNDDMFVCVYTDYDYENADEREYPDNGLHRTFEYYDYDGRKLGSYEEYADSSENYYNYRLDSKGNLYFTHSIGNYDEDGYYTAYEIAAYNMKGALRESVIFEDAARDFIVKDIAIDASDRLLIVTSEGIMLYEAGERTNQIDYEDMDDFANIYPLDNGDMLVRRYGAEKDEYSVINVDSRKRSDIDEVPFGSGTGLYSIGEGTDTDLVFCADSGVYTYNVGDKDCEFVMGVPVYDLLIYGLEYVRIADNGDVFGVYYDRDTDGYALGRFTPKDMSGDTRNRLILGCLAAPDYVLSAVEEYNNSDKDSRIIVHNYVEADIKGDYAGAAGRLKADIDSGNMPDILLVDYMLPYREYMSKGLMADQKPLIEADPDLELGNYAPNVIEALSTGRGELAFYSPDFIINTAFAKTYMMGDRMGNRLNDYLNASNMSGASVYTDITRDSLLYNIMRAVGEDYIDWDRNVCDFDNTDFTKLLSFAGTYPADYDYSYDNSHDWPYNGYAVPYRNDAAICEIRSMYDLYSYVEAYQGVFGEPVTMVGFPTDSDMGSSLSFNYLIGISAASDDIDGAWRLVKRFYDTELADEAALSIPTAKKQLEREAREAGGRYKSYTETDDYEWVDPTYLAGSDYVYLSPLTRKEYDALLESIYRINRVSMEDTVITGIISEEATGYFMGAYDAATAAKSIQERVTEYLMKLSGISLH